MFHTGKKRGSSTTNIFCNNSNSTRRLNRKGQFTIFVILGIIILSVFALAIYARLKILSSQLGQQADVQLNNYLTNNAINQYVTSCLEVVTDDVLLTTSMQGGLLNSTDKIENVDYISYYHVKLNKTFNVSIIIDANYNCPDNRPEGYVVTQEPGPYPYTCGNKYLRDLPRLYTTYGTNCKNNCTGTDFWMYSGFFGINNLSILCNPRGANAPGIISGANTCEYYSYYRKSLQQLMEEKITNDINICVNFTEILRRSPSNITTVGDVNATIQFNQEGFIVKLAYPFTITLRNKQPVTRMVDFSVYKNIPFKELYEYSYELANHDVKDARFEIFRDKDKVISKGFHQRGVNMYTSDFEIKIIDGDETNNFIRLVQVTNTKRNLLGVPLMINFGVKNRIPALEYIHNDNSEYYDLVAVENRTIVISPQGYDPDDEQLLRYTYAGWLEDYTDYYNWSDLNCSRPSSFMYILENCTKRNTTTTDADIPHSWTLSQPYIDTRRNASHSASRLDVGLHNVIVSVYDRYNRYDYQNVRVLVFDMPVARINGSNDYEDVENNRASYEDKYLLNGAESSVGAIASTLGRSFTNFSWNDTEEPFEISKRVFGDNIATKMLFIPNDTTDNPSEISIMNITKYIFRNKTYPDFIHYVIHNITLEVKTEDGLTDTNKFYVNVTRCLNHSSNIPSYPFDILYNVLLNNLTGHLMADHTCCGDDMNYKDTNTECYNATEFGMNRSFRDYSALPDTEEYGIIYTLQSQYDNDIFNQTFIAKCSGNRGNTCTGDLEEWKSVVEQCQDDNIINDNTFQNERCSGPSALGPFKNRQDIFCANYTSGNTFEIEFETGATGICTTTKQCATGNYGVFRAYVPSATNPIFKYSCDGTCSGDGRCNTPTACICNSSCGATNVNVSCNGLPGSGTPTSLSCIGGASPYFADTCSDCGLVDLDNTCVFNPAITGCNAAAANCNNVQPGAYARDGGGNNFCLATDTTRWARCNNICQVITVPSSTCQRGTGCTTDSECENNYKSALINASNPREGCNNLCQYRSCLDDERFNPSNGNCELI